MWRRSGIGNSGKHTTQSEKRIGCSNAIHLILLLFMHWRLFNQQGGFTLMELIVSVGIFMIVMTSASGIFIYNQRAQKRVQMRLDMQSAVSYAFEKMAYEIRYGSIVYPDSGNFISPSESLLIHDATGMIFGFKKGDNGQCRAEGSQSCLLIGKDLDNDGNVNDDEYTPLTGSTVKVTKIKFFFSPTQDPFALSQTGYASSQQPIVTVFLETELVSDSSSILQLQTTVTPRHYER